MKAHQEATRLQEAIAKGAMHPNEPIFILRGRDTIAAKAVRLWITLAKMEGTPPDKLEKAEELAKAIEAWPEKQVPGRPETKIRIHTSRQ